MAHRKRRKSAGGNAFPPSGALISGSGRLNFSGYFIFFTAKRKKIPKIRKGVMAAKKKLKLEKTKKIL
jgi:hypothetical protein